MNPIQKRESLQFGLEIPPALNLNYLEQTTTCTLDILPEAIQKTIEKTCTFIVIKNPALYTIGIGSSSFIANFLLYPSCHATAAAGIGITILAIFPWITHSISEKEQQFTELSRQYEHMIQIKRKIIEILGEERFNALPTLEIKPQEENSDIHNDIWPSNLRAPLMKGETSDGRPFLVAKIKKKPNHNERFVVFYPIRYSWVQVVCSFGYNNYGREWTSPYELPIKISDHSKHFNNPQDEIPLILQELIQNNNSTYELVEEQSIIRVKRAVQKNI